MLRKMLDHIRPKRLDDDLTYEKARNALESDAQRLHKALAERTDTPPEMLYYLAENAKPPVRALIAANPATPQKADLILAGDGDDEVRCELARKIARLLPDLSADEQIRVREGMIEVLERLAQDHLPKVRRILAGALKASPVLPHHIALKLAQDADGLVCVPIIEYSPLLRDEDLLEIVATSRISGVLEAIARREGVSGSVADAVVATLDIPAVAALLANPSAQIREQALDMVIENAQSVESWHAPLVMRPDLSLRAIRRIAGFVASALIDKLAERNDLDAETQALIKGLVRGRIDKEQSWSDGESDQEAAEKEAKAAFEAGLVDDAYLDQAMQMNKRDLCICALACKAGLPGGTIKRILASRNAKSVTALLWKAGLSMRTAVEVQKTLAHIPHQQVLFAHNGMEYPLSADEMQWHVEYFTASKP